MNPSTPDHAQEAPSTHGVKCVLKPAQTGANPAPHRGRNRYRYRNRGRNRYHVAAGINAAASRSGALSIGIAIPIPKVVPSYRTHLANATKRRNPGAFQCRTAKGCDFILREISQSDWDAGGAPALPGR